MKYLCPGIIILMVFVCTNSMWAQKWGKVSRDILEATTFSEAPEADAIILFDIGELEIREVEHSFESRLKRHIRIKILTESGKEKYSDITIPFSDDEEIKSLKAQTILPDGQKIKIDKDNLFEEKFRHYKQKVFAMPAVETGAVIEYSYELHSGRLYYLEPWYFQNELFTNLSRFRFTVPARLNYHAFFKNVRDFDPTPQVSEHLIPGLARKVLFEFFWEYEDITPLKEEPYIWNIKDYYTALFLQFLEINRRDYLPQKFAQDWQNASHRFAERLSDYFEEDNGLKDLSTDITFPAANDLKKAERIYAYVSDSILTTNTWENFKNKPSQVYKSRSGSAFDKNILLLNLLNHAGLSPRAIFISTLPHGHFNEELVDLLQFDHLLVRLSIENRDYYLDAQEKFCPFNTLPPASMVEKGLLIDKLNGQIVELPSSKDISMFRVDTDVRLDTLGNLAGQSNFRIDGYYAMEERQKISQKGEDDYIGDLLKKNFAGTQIDSFRIINIEKLQESLVIEINYRIPEVVNMEGEIVYVEMPLLNPLKSNPFQNPERLLPVEFPYKRSDQEEINLILPPGYRVSESPQPAVVRAPKMHFRYSSKTKGDTLQVQYQYLCRQTTFQPEEYKKLQSFYDEMIKTTQAPAVLKKTGSGL